MSDTKLDELVRRSILRYPLIFTCRWDVLRHLYLTTGGGFEWVGGELVDVHADLDPYPGDDACRAGFFDDIDERSTKMASMLPSDVAPIRDDSLERARRQFVLDNLDLLVHESLSFRMGGLNWTDVAVASVKYSHAFNVPDDAEASFKAGAVEVLDVLIPGLHYAAMRGWDGGLREAAGREKERLAPIDHAALQNLIQRVLRDTA